jgi:hypothetical protein
VVPLNYIVSKVEHLNWLFILKEKTVDFEKISNAPIEAQDNSFWFINFLRNVVNLPCFFIFQIYYNLLINSQEEQDILTLTLDILQIIRLWSLNVEIYFYRLQKKDARIQKFLSDDYVEFVKLQSELERFLRDSYVNNYIIILNSF